jgi:hypothetical protein
MAAVLGLRRQGQRWEIVWQAKGSSMTTSDRSPPQEKNESTNSSQLKPCPFCDEENPLVSKGMRGDDVVLYVECPMCGGMGPLCETMDVAEKMWNDRAPVADYKHMFFTMQKRKEELEIDAIRLKHERDDIVGLLQPIAEQDWHGKWRIVRAVRILNGDHIADAGKMVVEKHPEPPTVITPEEIASCTVLQAHAERMGVHPEAPGAGKPTGAQDAGAALSRSSDTLIALLKAMVEEHEIGHEIADDGRVFLYAQDVYKAIREHAPSEISVVEERNILDALRHAIQMSRDAHPFHIADICLKAIRPYLREPKREAVHRWQPMDTVPKKEDEVFLVRLPGNDVCKTLAIQVSVFEGRMYPDCKDGLIDWDDAIVGADAWSPLPTEIEGESS